MEGREELKVTKVAIYTRRPADELAGLRRRAAEEYPGTPVQEYADEPEGRIFDAPGFRRLRQAIEAGEVHAVVSHEADALSRDFADSMDWVRVVLRAGIEVVIPGGGTETFRDRVEPLWRLVRRGGAQPGNEHARRWTAEQAAEVRRLRSVGVPVDSIVEQVGLSRATIYRLLRRDAADE